MPPVLRLPLLLTLAFAALGISLPPLTVDILDRDGVPRGKAQVFQNYVRLQGPDGAPRGAIGVVMAEGSARLFLVGPDRQRKLLGWSRNHRLFDAQNKLVGYYSWTPIWSYVYDAELKRVGQAQCLAYQGVCAAGVAGFLLGLL